MKLDPTKSEYDQEWGWVAHPDALTAAYGYSARDNKDATSVEAMLVKRRYDLDIVGGVNDDDASYSYDDWALCKLDGDYYLLSTSGCSCPSPRETWRVEIGPATLADIERHIQSGAYEGYTVPKKQEAEFLKLLRDEAAKT